MPMAVGAHPRNRPLAPASAMVILNPLPRFLYFSLFTWSLHFTKSSGVTAVWVNPQDRAPPTAHRAKYFIEPNSHEYSSVAAAVSDLGARGVFSSAWRGLIGLAKRLARRSMMTRERGITRSLVEVNQAILA